MTCPVFREPCPIHHYVHGAEAEALRRGIERILKTGDPTEAHEALSRLLDQVDARDSLAFLEARDRVPMPEPTAEVAQLQRRADSLWQAWDATQQELAKALERTLTPPIGTR